MLRARCGRARTTVARQPRPHLPLRVCTLRSAAAHVTSSRCVQTGVTLRASKAVLSSRRSYATTEGAAPEDQPPPQSRLGDEEDIDPLYVMLSLRMREERVCVPLTLLVAILRSKLRTSTNYTKKHNKRMTSIAKRLVQEIVLSLLLSSHMKIRNVLSSVVVVGRRTCYGLGDSPPWPS